MCSNCRLKVLLRMTSARQKSMLQIYPQKHRFNSDVKIQIYLYEVSRKHRRNLSTSGDHTAGKCERESASRTSHFIRVNPSPNLTAHGPSQYFSRGGQNADMHANSQLSVALSSSVNAHRSPQQEGMGQWRIVQCAWQLMWPQSLA